MKGLSGMQVNHLQNASRAAFPSVKVVCLKKTKLPYLLNASVCMLSFDYGVGLGDFGQT